MSRRKRYSAEFKREAIRRANEEGVTDVLVAEELGLNARQLRRWREAIRQDGDKAFPGEGNAKDQELMLWNGWTRSSRRCLMVQLMSSITRSRGNT